MKKTSVVVFALIAALGMTPADSASTQTASSAHAPVSTSLLAQGIDFAMTGIGPGQNSNAIASAAICEPGTADLVIHDDGEAENAYGWNPSNVNLGRYADKFTPAVYPASIDTVCFSFITNSAITSFDFDVIVYADDGVGGIPGSVLGRKSFTGHPEPYISIPFTPVFEAFDVSDLGLDIASRSVFIAVEWEVAPEQGIFIAADQSPTTPLAGGYSQANEQSWALIQTTQSNYRALMMRAIMPGDALFCSGFELDEDGSCGAAGDIVVSGPIDHAIQEHINGTSVNWITGDIQDAEVNGYHFNPYRGSSRLTFYWSLGAPENAGVSASEISAEYLVLQSGAVIGPASVWSKVTTPGPVGWAAGANGYLGFRFNCSSLPAPPVSGICYGYVHLQTTSPTGFPATILDYAYDKSGAAITIP